MGNAEKARRKPGGILDIYIRLDMCFYVSEEEDLKMTLLCFVGEPILTPELQSSANVTPLEQCPR